VPHINEWMSTIKEKINIIVIYISEAHADDEWPISLRLRIKQHQKIEERIAAAKKMVEEMDIKFPIFVDSMNPINFESVYAGWPERGYIIHKGIIEMISSHECESSASIWFEEANQWLEENKFI